MKKERKGEGGKEGDGGTSMMSCNEKDGAESSNASHNHKGFEKEMGREEDTMMGGIESAECDSASSSLVAEGIVGLGLGMSKLCEDEEEEDDAGNITTIYSYIYTHTHVYIYTAH